MKRKLLFSFCLSLIAFFSAHAQDWEQLGNTIPGEAASDQFGRSVSLSSDGMRIAVGSTANGSVRGHVRVFEFTNGNWVQLGSDIDGEQAGDGSGVSIALSADGSRVIIGASLNDGNGTQSGHARIYEYQGNSWIQLGGDLDGEAAGDRFGNSVDISSDGNRVVVGGPFNDGSGTDAGHARVFDYNQATNSWQQVGSDLNGISIQHYTGNAVSISGDGSRIAIGSIYGGSGNLSGYVRIYQENAGNWSLVGSLSGSAANESFGKSVDLDAAGVNLIVGANLSNSFIGRAAAYRFVAGTFWVQTGAFTGSVANEQMGTDVSMSSNGQRILITSPGGGTGIIRVYEYNGTQWSQLGSNVGGATANEAFGFSGAISEDGTKFAGGSPLTTNGQARVFDFVIPSPPVITSIAALDFQENGTGPVLNVESSDSNGDTEGNGLTYSFSTENGGGIDNALFSLVSSTGEISFINSPDFETPVDGDTNNEYLVQVTVTDSGGLTDVQDIQITITDLDEIPPTITCPAAISANAGDSCQAFAGITNPTGSDNVSAVLVYTGIRRDGLALTDPFLAGQTIIDWTASDEAGNVSNTCQQTITVNSTGNCWSSVGDAVVNSDSAGNMDFAKDSNGNLYLAYFKQGSPNQVIAQKYDGTSWSMLGGVIYENTNIIPLTMAVSNDGVPHVAYYDWTLRRHIVKRFEANNWVDAFGVIQGTNQEFGTPFIEFNGLNELFVLYGDSQSKLTVKRWSGSGWITTGSASFSLNTFGGDLVFDANNIPYVAYQASGSSPQRLSVQRLINGSWEFVGNQEFSVGTAGRSTIKIDPSGTPYVAYYDSGASNTVLVQKFNGTDWVQVGTSPWFGFPDDMQLEFDSAGIPYISLKVSNQGYFVKRFENGSWVSVGGSTPIIPAGTNNFYETMNLCFDNSNPSSPILYTAFGREGIYVKSIVPDEVPDPATVSFITTWKTDNPGVSNDNQITIPVNSSYGYNYTVDWGDGNSDTGVNGTITHTYATAGTYDVAITGTFPAIRFNDNDFTPDTDSKKLLEVKQWGAIQWLSFASAFEGCANMDVTATDIPDLSATGSLAFMFDKCSSLVFNESINSWDLSNVTEIFSMFRFATLFNQPLDQWNVSNVQNFGQVFSFTNTFNQNINNWDMSNAIAMFAMFREATAFNQSLDNWDVSDVFQFNSAFLGATSFNQSLGSWDIGAAQQMGSMLNNTALSPENYNNTLIGWNTLDISGGETQVPAGQVFDALGVSYSTPGSADRQNLIDTFGWTINDAGNIDLIPQVVSVFPANGATEVPLDTAIEITFDRNIVSSTGLSFLFTDTNFFSFVLAESFGTAVVSGNKVTFTPGDNALDLDPNSTTTISIPADAFVDESGNAFPGTSWSFSMVTTTDSARPQGTFNPLSGSTDILQDQVFQVVFDEEIIDKGSAVTIFNGDGTQGLLSLNNAFYTLDFDGSVSTLSFQIPSNFLAFEPSTAYRISIPAFAFEDVAGNDYFGTDFDQNGFQGNGASWQFTTSSTIDLPTQATFLPADDTSLVPANQVLSATFNELMQIPDENLEINLFRVLPGGVFSVYDSYSVAEGDLVLTDDGNVSTLTITPNGDLPPNTPFQFNIVSGFLEDINGNPWDGTSNGTNWRFNTGLGNAPCTSGDVDLSITFDQFAEKNSWQLLDQNGVVIQSATYTNAFSNTTIDVQFTNLADGTYTFTMSDTFGLGMCCSFGNGSFSLSKNGNALFTGGQFAFEQSFQFCIDASIDSELPVISCAQDINQDLGTSCSGVLSITNPTATDNVSTVFTYEGVRSDGFALTDPFFVGITTITWTATDEAGNVSLPCTQTVTLTSSGACWFDVGPEISGTLPFEQLGSGVAINAEGDIAAYVSPNRNGNGNLGDVFVLQRSGNTWNPLGNTLIGGGGAFGRALSGIDLNDAGNRLAVSQLEGKVKVYELTNGTWSLLGGEIPSAGTTFTQKLDLNSTGDRLIVGYAGENFSTGTVIVYELQGGQWQQLGQTLTGDEIGDFFGRDVNLNMDGSRLAVGAYQLGADAVPSDQGYVRTFELVEGSWVQLGQDLICPQPTEFFGVSIGFNDAGNRLVIGDNAGDLAKVFELTNGNWQQLGNTILPDIALFRQPGYQVDINGVGDVVVIGDFTEPTRMFQLNGSTWTQLGQPIFGELGQDVSMNRTGNRVIIGGPDANGQAGRAAIYEYGGVLDNISPTIVNLSPAQNQTDFPVDQNFEFTFSEPVQWVRDPGANTIILIFDNTAQDFVQEFLLDDPAVSFNGAVVTVNPSDDLLPGHNYTITINFETIEDLAGNDFGPTLNYNFTTAEPVLPFVTTWKTDNPGISNDDQITIPTSSDYTYNYTVDWGDGMTDTNLTGDATHTYASPGTYTVSITGDFPFINFAEPRVFGASQVDNEKILSVEQWGSVEWVTTRKMFLFCENLQVNATDAPDLSQVTDMSEMFFECSSLTGNPSFNDWDVSGVNNMGQLFQFTQFNQPLSNWDVSNVTTMVAMFNESNFNQDIGGWNTANVRNMQSMFAQTPFNQDIGGWNTSQVTTIGGMFNNSDFNQDISGWDVSQVTNMSTTFFSCPFNQDIGGWDVSKVQRMASMFRSNTAFNQDISGWDVSSVREMSDMFTDTPFNQDISGWDVSSVTTMFGMFERAADFDQNLAAWDISSVNQMTDMFDGAGLSRENYDATLEGWATLDTVGGETAIPTNITFDGGNSPYCFSESFRTSLIDDFDWTITDGGISCPDTEAPVISCPADITLDAGANCSQVVSLTNPTATDNVSDLANIVFEGIRNDGQDLNSAFYPGTTLITWTATDEAGNISTSCTQSVTINSTACWAAVGQMSLSKEIASGIELELDNNDVPYVSYRNTATSRLNVQKFENGTWSFVGPENFSPGFVRTPKMALDPGNFPYVVYADGAVNQRLSVQRFNGTDWEYVGPQGFSAQLVDFPSIAFDSSGVPYVAFYDQSQQGKITVNRFNGTSWELVGLAGFSAGAVSRTFIAMDNNDTPFVAYRDGSLSSTVAVKSFNGSAWEDVGTGVLTPGEGILGSRILFTTDNKPTILGARNVGNVLFQFDGTDWVEFPRTGLPVNLLTSDLALDMDDVPYIALSDNLAGFIQRVYRYNASTSSWENVGNLDIVPGRANETKIQIDSEGNLFLGTSTLDAFTVKTILPEPFPDILAPTITCDDALVVGNDSGQCSAVLSLDNPVVSDNVSDAANIVVTVERSDDSLLTLNDPFPLGTTTLTYTATDEAGNESTCTRAVTVNDTEAPVLSCEADITQTSVSGQPLVIAVNPPSVVTDNCDTNLAAPVATRSDLAAIDAPFEVGTTQIEWAVTDASGNRGVCIQTVTVNFTASSASNITAFSVLGQSGSIQGTSITAEVPVGTDLTAVAPVITTSDFASVNPASGTPVDFSNGPVTYTVTAQDGTSQTQYQVSVSIGQRPFVTTWQTTGDNESITIPTFDGETYSYTVDWGDGTMDTNQTGDTTHSYATAGIYTVSISGQFPRIYFNNTGDKDKILTVMQWGDIPWTSMESSFYGCTNIDVVATDIPDLSLVTDMSRMFYFCQALIGTSAFNSWDVNTVTNMGELFKFTAFNQPISSWNVSSVVSMRETFRFSPFNQPIGNWDVSAVTDMSFMFSSNSAFNQPIGSWNVSSVTSLRGMFALTPSFNQPIGGWDVSSVTDMFEMFVDARAFDQPLDNWDVSAVTTMNSMFRDADVFNQSLSSWDVSSVEDMRRMFDRTPAFDQPIGNWDISSVTQMDGMFTNAGLSRSNYDATLEGWATLNTAGGETQIPAGLNFDGGNSQYCFSEQDRNSLINDFGWTITDGGINCPDTTAPTIVSLSPSQNQTDFPIDQNFEFTFSEPVQWVRDPGASTIILIFDNTAQDFAQEFLLDDPAVMFNGNLVTVDPDDLEEGHNYTITINNQTIEDLAGNDFGPALNYNFTTATSFRPFITTWQTSTANETITIPTFNGETYNYTVDWGDGTTDTNQTGDATHAYVNAGTYTVTISGEFPRIYFRDSSDKTKIRTVEQWGDNTWSSMAWAFRGCTNLQVNAMDAPDLSIVTDMRDMFSLCQQLTGNSSFNTWDTSNVQDFGAVFSVTAFDAPIGNWDTSSATSFRQMFQGAQFFNQPIGNWNTSNVTNMFGMFANTVLFNQPIGNWNTGKVENMASMFSNNFDFNQPIGNWDTAQVINMADMFSQAKTFNQDISGWNTSMVTDMSGMFFETQQFDQPIGTWNTGAVQDMSEMFSTSVFNQSLDNWDTSSVTDLSAMFAFNYDFNQSLGNWDISSVSNMTGIFFQIELSKENYDATLIGWADLDTASGEVQIPTGLSQDGTLSTFCLSTSARQSLIDNFGWTITDGGQAADCDNIAPTITCPADVETVIPDTDTSVALTLTNPTATDNISTVFTFQGTRSDGLTLADPFPVGDTTVSWTATDEAGNVSSSCDQLITVVLAETETVLEEDGTLEVSDCGPVTDDEFNLSTDGTNLILTNTAPIIISGPGVIQVDINTVLIPLDAITGGLTIDGVGGNDSLVLDTSLQLLGPDNGLTFNNLNVQLSGTEPLQLNELSIANSTFDLNGADVQVDTVINVFDGSNITGNGSISGTFNFGAGTFLSPGTSPGRIDFTDLTLGAGSTFNAEIDGPTPITEHDIVVVTGPVNVSGATLNLIGGYANAEGDIIVLIDNDGTDPIVGEFAGLPEGSLVSFGGFSGQISYQGGDGNDLVLTYAPPATASLPWSENFDELVEGSTIDTGNTAWSIAIDQGSLEVSNGKLEMKSVEGGSLAFFTTQEIDISEFRDVSISLEVSDLDQNNKENSDYIRAYYILDGAPQVRFGNAINDITARQFTVGNLNGNSLQLVVEIKVSWFNESFTVDNILIDGTFDGPVAATGVEVTPDAVNLFEGGAPAALSATVLPVEATNREVSWSSDNPSVAMVSPTGVVTPLSLGTAIITATTIDGGFTDSSTITVVEPPEGGVLPWIETFSDLSDGTTLDTGDTAWSIAIDHGSLEVSNGKLEMKSVEGGSLAFFTTQEIDISQFTDVSISVDVSDLDQNNKENSDYLRAYYVLNGGPQQQFGNVINDIAPQQFTVNNLNGSTLQLVIEIKVSWFNESFTVDNIVIEGTSVVPVAATGVDVNPANLSLFLGGASANLSANVLPAEATNRAVNWSSSNPSVAIVSATGEVTPLSLGTTVITATTVDGGFTDTSTIDVVEPPVGGGTLPWIESFDELSDGDTIDNGDTAWSIAIDQGSLEVSNGLLEMKSVEGGSLAFFTTQEIDISQYQDVSITLDVGDLDQNNKENSDYIRAFYVLDGSSPVRFGNAINDIAPRQFSIGNLNGSTLQLVIEVKVSWFNESFTVDNIVIDGTATVPTLGARIQTPLSIALTPNPAATFVNLSSSTQEEITQVYIYDLSGRLVRQFTDDNIVPSTQVRLEFIGLEQGMYSVFIRTDQGSEIQKRLIVK